LLTVPHSPLWRLVFSLPKIRLGRWSVGLAAVSVVLLIFGYGVFEVLMVRVLGGYQQTQWEGVVITFYGITMLLCGLAGGVLSLIALIRRHECSALVWLAMLPGLFVVFMLAEFVVPVRRCACRIHQRRQVGLGRSVLPARASILAPARRLRSRERLFE
jgi:hypothetical protein